MNRVVGGSETGRPSVCIVSHNAYGAFCGGTSGFIGGVEWQTSLLGRWLAGRGYAVSLLTWDEGGGKEEFRDGVRVVKICRQQSGFPGLRFVHPKWTGLVRAMARADADVYYHNCGDCVTGQVALWCRRNARGFVFSSASDADCHPRLPELHSRRERLLYRMGIRRAHRIIVQTRRQQRALSQYFRVDSAVIPMPCPEPRGGGSDAAVGCPPRVLWVGRVARVKRPDRLLELARSCPDLEFDLVGPLPANGHSDLIDRLKRGVLNVTVHGAVPREAMDSHYRSAAVLCCTSDYEGFPNTFLEAWSHGLPVVSTFDPDDLISRRNLGAVVADVAQMRQALKELFAAPDRYREMSANARKYYVQNHTLEAVMPRFEQVFREVAADFGGRNRVVRARGPEAARSTGCRE